MDGRVPPRERLQDFTRNGPKVVPTFSAAEMQRRLGAIRGHMAGAGVDAALLTSYHNICYYADFLYCQFGRRYGLVVDQEAATSISAGIDGGQPCAAQPSATTSPTPTGSRTTTSTPSAADRRREAARHRVRPCHARHAAPARGGVCRASSSSTSPRRPCGCA